MGLREFGAYSSEYVTTATQHATYRAAREWMSTGVDAATAAAWASLGYLPGEAAPLIAAGVTPEMAAEMEQLDIDIAGSPEERAAQMIDRLVAEGVLIDPRQVRVIREQ